MSPYEEILERRWEDAYLLMHRSTTPEGRQACWEELCGIDERLTAERILNGLGVSVPTVVGAAPHGQPRHLPMKTPGGESQPGV